MGYIPEECIQARRLVVALSRGLGRAWESSRAASCPSPTASDGAISAALHSSGTDGAPGLDNPTLIDGPGRESRPALDQSESAVVCMRSPVLLQLLDPAAPARGPDVIATMYARRKCPRSTGSSLLISGENRVVVACPSCRRRCGALNRQHAVERIGMGFPCRGVESVMQHERRRREKGRILSNTGFLEEESLRFPSSTGTIAKVRCVGCIRFCTPTPLWWRPGHCQSGLLPLATHSAGAAAASRGRPALQGEQNEGLACPWRHPVLVSPAGRRCMTLPAWASLLMTTEHPASGNLPARTTPVPSFGFAVRCS